jgi:hypothetical protein
MVLTTLLGKSGGGFLPEILGRLGRWINITTYLGLGT